MIERKLFSALKEHLSQREISLIVGPRQAGKTTLMLALKEYLEKQGARTLFMSLDFESDQPFFDSQRSLINKIQLEIGKDKGFVFIDEIQRKENAGIYLKGLYDMNLPYKFIVSGSGSMELKEKIHESLVGRKRVFELSTINFEEFVHFRTEYRYRDRLFDFFSVEKGRTRDFLIEYLNFGGYPRVVLEAELREKRRIMDEIYRSYLERDVSYLLKVEKVEAFSSLIRTLASQVGLMVNYSELSSTIGISLVTVKNYLFYAEKTFILQRVSPYFRNIRKEITKSPVMYFQDLGLRNYALGWWGNLREANDLGFPFQNFVLHLLREKVAETPAGIRFWRTKDNAEIDFILDYGQKVLPVEVKFKDLKEAAAGRSLRGFISRYKPDQAWVINLSLKESLEVNGTEVLFLPFHEILPCAPSLHK
jgi:predicted AAA+ superfamily ATPase